MYWNIFHLRQGRVVILQLCIRNIKNVFCISHLRQGRVVILSLSNYVADLPLAVSWLQ